MINQSQFFKEFLSPNQIIEGEEERKEYDHDYTEDLHYLPEIVLIPTTTEEVSIIARHCNENELPLTVRGAGTGLSGGALPVHGGVVLSMEKMNRILDIDEENFQATIEPGVITQVFQEEVAKKGLFYPPDPASKGFLFYRREPSRK